MRWVCDWKSEIGDIRKPGVVGARDPLGKPMLRGGTHPTHPYRSRRTIREMGLLTKYRSEETLTRMRSSPTRTFSPSDLCLEAGCIVHQQASPMSELTVRTMVSHNALPHGTHSHQVFPTLESINPQPHHRLPTSSPVWNVSIRMSKPSVPRPLFLAPGQTYAHL